jgi:hypothetical protein
MSARNLSPRSSNVRFLKSSRVIVMPKLFFGSPGMFCTLHMNCLVYRYLVLPFTALMAFFEAETSPDCAGVAGRVAASVVAADTVTGVEGGGGGSGSCLSADLDTAFTPCDPSLGAVG